MKFILIHYFVHFILKIIELKHKIASKTASFLLWYMYEGIRKYEKMSLRGIGLGSGPRPDIVTNN